MLWKVARVLSLGKALSFASKSRLVLLSADLYRNSQYLFVIPGGANVLWGRKTFLMDRPGPGQGKSIVDISILFRLQTCFFLFLFFHQSPFKLIKSSVSRLSINVGHKILSSYYNVEEGFIKFPQV